MNFNIKSDLYGDLINEFSENKLNYLLNNELNPNNFLSLSEDIDPSIINLIIGLFIVSATLGSIGFIINIIFISLLTSGESPSLVLLLLFLIGISIIVGLLGIVGLVIIICLFCFLFLDNSDFPEIGTIPAPAGNPNKFAIILCGSEVGGDAQDTIHQTVKNVYESLNNRGYTDDVIVYLNVVDNHDVFDNGENKVDGITCQKNFEKAINWLADYSDSGDQILIYIIGHGYSPLLLPTFGYTKLNTKSGINNVLWDFELGLILKNPNLQYNKLICVIESCYGGFFINDIADSNRIIMTCTDSQNKGWGLGTFFFSSSLFICLKNGINFRDAFKEAVISIDNFIEFQTSINPVFDWDQNPLLDDNGNGVGHQYVPEMGDGIDGGLSHLTFL